MRPITLLLALFPLICSSQVKQGIDEAMLTDMVLQAQEDVKGRFLSNLVQKNIHTTNYTTYNTLYDCVDIVVREKNKTVMTQELVRTMSEYAIAYALAKYVAVNAASRADMEAISNWTEATYVDTLRKRYSQQVVVTKKKGSGLKDRADSTWVGKFMSTNVEWKADEVPIDKLTPLIVGLDNFVIDTVYQILSAHPSLRNLGLFKRAKGARVWQWTNLEGIDYAGFWNASGNDSLRAKLDIGVKSLEQKLTKMNEILAIIAEAAGVEPDSLENLDLREFKDKDKIVKVMVPLFLKAAEYYTNNSGQNSLVARIANVITQYVIFDPATGEQSNYGFTVDVEGIILSLEDKLLGWNESPMKNCWLNVRPFFAIGLNYGYFGGPDPAFEGESSFGQQQVAWAGEKIGLKWRWRDWGYFKTREVGEPFKYVGKQYVRNVRPKVPLVSNLYGFAYGSGVLYTIADLRSTDEFNGIIYGFGTGVEFFNKLELNVSYAAPLNGAFEDGFVNVGFDIPIFKYIRGVKGNGN